MTLEAFRESYPTEQIWSVFEPRSNTSQTKLHQNQMPSSFDSADGIIIAPLHRPERIEESNRLDRQWILDQLVKAGKKAFLVDNYDEIIPLLKEHCSKKAKIVFMSNGAFGGIYQKVKNSF